MGGSQLRSAQASLREFLTPDLGRGWTAAETATLLPDHPLLRATLGGLMCAGPGAAAAGWRAGADCVQLVQRVGLDAVRVHLNGHDVAEAWREVKAFSPLALDVLCVVVARLLAQGGEVLLVRSAEILEAKGNRRCGEERQLLEQQIGRELMRLGRISLGDAELPLLTVTPVGERGTSFVVELDPQVKAGWAAAPLRPLSRRLLQFDHRSNRGADVLAKKMGLYFSLASCGSRPVVRSVRAVLKSTGALPELATGRGGRLADRFEEAVLRLNERGLFAVAYRGGGAGGLLDARVKGWVKRWLEAELVIEGCD